MDNKFILKRAEKLREEMAKTGTDAFVVLTEESCNWETLYYLSGFRGTSGALAVYKDSVELILDGRYREQGEKQSPYRPSGQKSSLVDDLIESISAHGAQKILCEATKTSHSTWEKLSSAKNTRWSDGANLISELRRSKDEQEVRFIMRSGEIAADAFLETLSLVRLGMTEKEFEALLNFNIIKFGGETGFEMIVASGTRSSMPHGRATKKEMTRGEWVTVDFGVRYNGYFCDITRNFSFGEPDPRAKDYHEILSEAHNVAFRALRCGATGTDVYKTAYDVLESVGLGKYFTHGLGHGLGIEIHEIPYLSSKYSYELNMNDVVTIEPGIYIDGWGGLRLEDNYLIIEQAGKRLTGKLEQSFYRV
ncbi:MAG: Xaa-Pro peptidase family protein [Synergistaceae bacterium]|nr:Xaa-Pro peptidase family protein [Synergistaceae bacterium]